jgi:hypothetical protein
VSLVTSFRPLLVSSLLALLLVAGASGADARSPEAELKPLAGGSVLLLAHDDCGRSGSVTAAERADAEDDPEPLGLTVTRPEAVATKLALVRVADIGARPAPVRRRPCAAPPTGPPA